VEVGGQVTTIREVRGYVRVRPTALHGTPYRTHCVSPSAHRWPPGTMPARGSARRNLCPRPKHNHLRVRQCVSRWVEIPAPASQNPKPPSSTQSRRARTHDAEDAAKLVGVARHSALGIRAAPWVGDGHTPASASSVRAPSLRTPSPRRAISTSLDPRCNCALAWPQRGHVRCALNGMVSSNLTPACLRSLSISAQESTRAHAHTQRELADIIERACPNPPRCPRPCTRSCHATHPSRGSPHRDARTRRWRRWSTCS
jgi:hypothetical protein